MPGPQARLNGPGPGVQVPVLGSEPGLAGPPSPPAGVPAGDPVLNVESVTDPRSRARSRRAAGRRPGGGRGRLTEPASHGDPESLTLPAEPRRLSESGLVTTRIIVSHDIQVDRIRDLRIGPSGPGPGPGP